MIKIICSIIGVLIAAGLYSLFACMFGYEPYNFSQTTWVGEILLLLWHVLGCLVGYVAGKSAE